MAIRNAAIAAMSDSFVRVGQRALKPQPIGVGGYYEEFRTED